MVFNRPATQGFIRRSGGFALGCRVSGLQPDEKPYDRCPTLAGFAGIRLYWPFEDPAAALGTPEARLEVFRKVRDQIDLRIIDWLEELRSAE